MMGRVGSSTESLDIYKKNKFALFRNTFDSVLKDLHQKCIGCVKKQAEVISREDVV